MKEKWFSDPNPKNIRSQKTPGMRYLSQRNFSYDSKILVIQFSF